MLNREVALYVVEVFFRNARQGRAGNQPLRPVLLGQRRQVVLLAAFPAEGQREQHPFPVRPVLARHPELAGVPALQGGVHAAPRREPLMKAEGEQGPPAHTPGCIARFEHPPERIAAPSDRRAALLRQLPGRLLESLGRPPDQPPLLLVEAESRLRPGRQRMPPHRLGLRRRSGRFHRCPHLGGSDGGPGRGRPLQRFVHHIGGGDVQPEELRHQLGYGPVALLSGPAGDHGGAGSHRLEILPGRLLQPAGEHRRVRPLPPAIEMQLIHHQGAQIPGRRLEKRPFVRAQQHVLGHHVVGQQDVRRLGDDALAVLLALLAGETVETHRRAGKVVALKLLERIELAVDEGVHRIDEQRPHRMPLRFVAEDGVEDRHQVGEALARPGAGRYNIRFAAQGDVDGLPLMPEEPQVLAEEPGRVGLQHPLARQLPQGAVHLEGRVELEDRLRPESPLVQLPVDVVADPPVEHPHEAADIFLILRNHLLTKLEDIQRHGLLTHRSGRAACRAPSGHTPQEHNAGCGTRRTPSSRFS